jgi:formyl-CoA transferase
MATAVPKPEGGELRLVGPAIHLSRTPSRMKRAIGAAGEHNEEIFRELGFTEEEIVALRSDKVI